MSKKFLDAQGVSTLWNQMENTLEAAVNVIDQKKADITYVDEAIANAGHLTRKIVTEIPTADTAEENVIYIFKVEDATGNDRYQEYILNEGEVILIGDTSVDLTGYAKIKDDNEYSSDTTWSSQYIYNLVQPKERCQYILGNNGYIKIWSNGNILYNPTRLTITNEYGEVVEIYGSTIGYTSTYQEKSYKAVRLCYGDKDSNDATVPNTYIKKIIHDYTGNSCFYVQVQGVGIDYQVLGAKDDIEFVTELPVSDKQIEIPIAPMFGVNDEATSTGTTWSSQKISDELAMLPGGDGSKTYTALSQLGLTADATLEDAVDALHIGASLLIPVNAFTNYETIFPNNVPNDQWNKVHIVKGTSLASSHIRCFSPSGTSEYLANINGTSIVGWINVSGTYIDVSESIIEKLGTEILKYPIGKYRINSTTIGSKFTDLPTRAEIKCGLIEINGTAVGKSPFTDAWVYRMYKFETLTGSSIHTRRLNSGATAGQIEVDTGWKKVGQETFTTLEELGLTADATINDVRGALQDGETCIIRTDAFNDLTQFNNIQYGYLKITRTINGLCEIWLNDVTAYGNRLYYGRQTSGQFTDWRKIIVENSMSDPYSCTGYTVLTGTEDLFTLAPGHYVSANVDTAYNYPVTSSNTTAHIYVLGALNDPTNNKGYRIILYFDNRDRMYRINEWWGKFDNGWQNMKDNTTLVTNTATLKLDVTKKMAAWYGAIKLTYLYDTSPVEVEIDFRGVSDPLKWTIVNGQKYIKAITYTQDTNDTKHYTIGIQFSSTTYGCYQAEVIGGFADINSLTADAFTGDSTAVYGNSYGKNNGVTLVSAPEDLGLTSPCTTVELAQAMRNTFNKTITSGAIGVFNNGGQTITDAPSEYGLLHIETFGYDRIMVRYDGINGSNYVGSWIGQIQSSNGAFSGINWQCVGSATAPVVETQDCDWTTITTVDDANYSLASSKHYCVRNGIVFIRAYVNCNTAVTNSWTTIGTGLPLPKSFPVSYQFLSDGGTSAETPLTAFISNEGTLDLIRGKSGTGYWVNISYPVV